MAPIATNPVYKYSDAASNSARNCREALFGYSVLCCGVEKVWAFELDISMHICFQCILDYSLWTKPEIWFLFWKMLKKTYDSNNLHSAGGTWCSQILCDRSCSLIQPALNRKETAKGLSAACDVRPSSPDSTCDIPVHGGGGAVGTERTRAVVKPHLLTCGCSERDIQPPCNKLGNRSRHTKDEEAHVHTPHWVCHCHREAMSSKQRVAIRGE